MSEFIMKAKDIRKSFAGVKALQGVDLEIQKGEIHCLAGENGCGKSTLIKIISGVYSLDSGTIEFNGVKQERLSPIIAIRNGIQVIYQDLSIFPNLSVMENLAYNSELMNDHKLVKWRRLKNIAEEAIAKIDFKVDLNSKLGSLSVADKQLVAISRALINEAKLIIMDEPTTTLTKKEVEALFRIIKKLQKQGIAILFVSHKLDEVFEISEKYTILRNGQNVSSGFTSDLNRKSFTYYMTGRNFDDKHFVNDIKANEKVLEVKNLTLYRSYDNISFDVSKGEIVAITGLLGSGRTELALSLFGLNKPDSGMIIKDGKKVKLNSVNDAIKNKIGYVPEDRLSEGLFLEQSISRNILISKLKSFSNIMGIINKPDAKTEALNNIEKLNIKVSDPELPVSTLSGGNQQKVVLAKWLATQLDVLILNGPTVGVDIGSKHDICDILKELAKQGMAIIIISDDLPEVVMNSSKILIMRDGKIVANVNPTEISEDQLASKIVDKSVGEGEAMK